MISNLEKANGVIFDKIDEVGRSGAAQLHSIDDTVRKICIDLKLIQKDMSGLTAEQDRIKDEIGSEEVAMHDMVQAPPHPNGHKEDPLDGQPIGWLNIALKKLFSSPAFWILLGWFLLRSFVFREPPPFMKAWVEAFIK